MKKIQTPPPWSDIARELGEPQKIAAILKAVGEPSVGGEYLHWDELCHRQPPGGISTKEWWLGLKMMRRAMAKVVPLCDNAGEFFSYALPEPIPEMLHEIDLGAGGVVKMPDPITNTDTRDQYYVQSLMEEAITSSQLEGASTTRRIAKELLRSNRAPRDKSEQMIVNNFRTMREIGSLKGEPLTPERVFALHRVLTAETLDDPSAAGRFRRSDEEIVVGDATGQVFHDPPEARQLAGRLEAMCAFANGETPEGFVHPALRSIVLHFWLAYDHPFVDGNGRVARALFYWSMLRHNYWLFEYVSISRILAKAPVQYARSYLCTETDENDLTYFILHQLEVIRQAVRDLHRYIAMKTREIRRVEKELKGLSALNHRQRSLISHALRHPHQEYTIESHRMSQNVVYQTARADLLDLVTRGLLRMTKVGKAMRFHPVPGLDKKLTRPR